jgi:hypothetical protein
MTSAPVFFPGTRDAGFPPALKRRYTRASLFVSVITIPAIPINAPEESPASTIKLHHQTLLSNLWSIF